MTAQGTFQDRPFVRRKCSVAIGANLYVTRSRTARRLLESARFGKRRANSNRYAAQRLPSSPINALRADVAHGKRGSITHPRIGDKPSTGWQTLGSNSGSIPNLMLYGLRVFAARPTQPR